MGTLADSIRSHVLGHYIDPARRRGEETITIVAKTILRDLRLRGDRAPSVCRALDAKKFCKENDLELVRIDGPEAKSSTTTSFTYRLPQRSEVGLPKPARNAIRDLRGIGRDMFAGVGGGERWLRKEREAFDAALADGVLHRQDDQRDVRKRELADRLREMIGAAEWGEKTTIAALFGILYCQEIKAAGGAAGIAEQAGTGSTGTVNVNLGCRLADYVTPNDDVVDAWKNRPAQMADHGVPMEEAPDEWTSDDDDTSDEELEAHDETVRTAYREYREASAASHRQSPASGRWLRRYGASAEELEALRLAVAARCPQVRFCGWTRRDSRTGEYRFSSPVSGRSVAVQAPTAPNGELRLGLRQWRLRLMRRLPGHARDQWEELAVADVETLDEVVSRICARTHAQGAASLLS